MLEPLGASQVQGPGNTAAAHEPIAGIATLGRGVGDTYGRLLEKKMGRWRHKILLDARGRVAAAYGVLSLPITFVIGPDGRVAEHVQMGSLDREGLERILDRHPPD